MKVLIVEDDMMSVIYLKSFLSRYGKCDCASDGIQAVERFSQSFDHHHPYDLVCLDIMIPGIDGLQVLSTIRDIEKEKEAGNTSNLVQKSKVIMVSALNDNITIEHARDAGCDAYLGKPVSMENLTQTLCQFGLIPR